MTDDSDFFKDLLTRIDEAAVEITPEEIECRDKKDFFDSLCEDPADFKRRKEAEDYEVILIAKKITSRKPI